MNASDKEQSFYTYMTPFGPLTLGADATGITRVALGERDLQGTKRATELLNRCANEFMEYFAGKRSVFSVPLRIEGTGFQKSVWEIAASIPYGHSMTAREVAAALGNPDAYRMVGQAVKRNSLVILIPAHRIVNTAQDESSKLRAAFRELERRYA